MVPNITAQSAYFSNWAILLSWFCGPFYEVVFTGDRGIENLRAVSKYFIPNKVVSGSIIDASKLDPIQNKIVPGKSLIYVCENYSCLKPVALVDEAVRFLTEA